MRVAGGLALALATSDAYAQSELPKRSIGDQGYTFAPYAQLHFAWQQVDDGRASTGNIVDITNANSRVGFYIERPDAMGFSFQFESGLGFRPSAKTSQTNTPVFFDWSRRDLRQVQVIHRSQAGTFRLGHGSMPLDGAAESDLGKTVVVAKSTIPEANGSYILRSTTGVLTPLTIGDTFDNYDGTRRLRLRYDTPDFSGFSLAVAYGEEVLRSGDDNTYYDVAIRYEGQVGNLDIIGALGSAYADDPVTGTSRVSIGSVSVLDQRSGLNASLAAGQDAASGAEYVYLKGGWTADLIAPGATKLVFEAFRGADYASAGSASRMYGLGIIQEIDRASLETYLGYRHFSYEDAGPTEYLDLHAVQFGARWRF